MAIWGFCIIRENFNLWLRILSSNQHPVIGQTMHAQCLHKALATLISVTGMVIWNEMYWHWMPYCFRINCALIWPAMISTLCFYQSTFWQISAGHDTNGGPMVARYFDLLQTLNMVHKQHANSQNKCNNHTNKISIWRVN